MKIVADSDIPLVKQLFSTIGDVILCSGREISLATITDADVLIVRTITTIDESLLQGSKVKIIASATSGVDHVDREYLNQRGIGFCYAPGCNARSVAEYVLSAVFVLASQNDFDLKEKRVGIIGCGHVGSQVMRFLQDLGIQCIVNDPPLKESVGGDFYHELDEVLAADIISLHVPLIESGPYKTRHLVDKIFLDQIKDNAILINTSRGQVIDEIALREFIGTGNDACVVLDVWDNEPLINLELLARVDIGTAHIAGYSMDGKLNATLMVYQAVCEYFNLEIGKGLVEQSLDCTVTEISVMEFDNDIDAVQLSVMASYDVRSDSASLRQILDVSKEQRAGFFDDLRSSYPTRREFHATRVSLPPAESAVMNNLSALGFNVVAIQ